MKKGDRVIVTDLRTGNQEPGTITRAAADPADGSIKFVNVQYDSGQHVRVGVTFVRAETTA